jgi:hypothetical protein
LSDKSLTKLFIKSCGAINPVILGGGSNIKMAEYIQMGLPIISTHKGIRGYENTDLQSVKLIRPEDFSTGITDFVCLGGGNRKHNEALTWDSQFKSFSASWFRFHE